MAKNMNLNGTLYLRSKTRIYCFHNAACFSLYEHLQTETHSIVEYIKLLPLMVHTNYLWFIIGTTVKFH